MKKSISKMIGILLLLGSFLPCLLAVSEEGPARKSAPGKADKMRQEPPPPSQQGMFRGFLNTLPEEEQKEYRKMAFENPEKFREEMQKRIQERHKQGFDELMNLRSKYLNASTQEEKDAVKAQIESKFRKQMETQLERTRKRIEESEKQLEDMQERLDRFKKNYEERLKDAEKMIEKGVGDFTDPNKEPKFELPPPPPREQNRPEEKPEGPPPPMRK